MSKSDDIVIHIQNLSKFYPIYAHPQDRLKQSIYPRLHRLLGLPVRSYAKEFWALKNVSLTVRKGETIGVIGPNGSGKSTLLQIICGTLSATGGTVKTIGRIAALLELGSGFNPDFTGRENVYLNGELLGLSREEIDACYSSIVSFADIGDFIEQPIKKYSSGMIVRLAFAVQAQVKPDILIIDEALAVGDAKFQVKCFERLRQLKNNGTSILLVTHSTEQIATHCSRAMLLNRGVQMFLGEPIKVVNLYMDLLFGKEKREIFSPVVESKKTTPCAFKNEPNLCDHKDVFSERVGYNPHEYRWGDGGATIIDYFIESEGELYPASITTGHRVRLGVSIKFNLDIVRPIFGFTVRTKEGVTVYGTNTELLDCIEFQGLITANTITYVDILFNCILATGDYFISLGVASSQGENVIPHDRRYDSIHLQVLPNKKFFGLADFDITIDIKQKES